MKYSPLAAVLAVCQFLSTSAWCLPPLVKRALHNMQSGCGQNQACRTSVQNYQDAYEGRQKLVDQINAASASLQNAAPGENYDTQRKNIEALQGQLGAADARVHDAYGALGPSLRDAAGPVAATYQRASTNYDNAQKAGSLSQASGPGAAYQNQTGAAVNAEGGLRTLAMVNPGVIIPGPLPPPPPAPPGTGGGGGVIDPVPPVAPGQPTDLNQFNSGISQSLDNNAANWGQNGIDFNSGAGSAKITDPDAAKKYLDQSLKNNPDNPDALALRGVANSILGNNAAACADAKAALGLNSSNKSAYSTARLTCAGGADLMSLGNPGPAPTPTQNPPLSQAETGAAASLGAVPAFRPMSQLDSAQSASLLQNALESMTKHNLRLALESATAAVENDPHNIDAWLLRASALKAAGNYGQVLSDMNASLKFNPGNLKLLNEKAYAQNRLKDYSGSLETSNLMIQADPTNAQAYANKAFALGGLGDREGMTAALKTAASLDPQFQAALDAVLKGTGSAADLFGLLKEPAAKAPAAGSARKEVKKRLIVGVALVLLVGLSSLIARKRSELSSMWTGGRSSSPSSANGAASSGTLQGKFKVGALIGAGGMGQVFEGEDTSLGRKVAIKKMLPQLAAEPRSREKFISEARTVAALHHPNIVDIHAIVEEEKDIYLVFEYVAGRTLQEFLAQRGQIPFPEAAKIIRGVADALDFAHGKDIIHRDLKPSNVMINETGRVVVMDFGVARAAKDLMTQAAYTNTVMGTPAYMAPEQEEGVVCKQSDVYSLAILFYELLTGKRPFEGAPGAMMVGKLAMTYKPASQLASGLPSGLDGFFARALAADPRKRLSSVKELVAALDALTPAAPVSNAA